VSDILGYTIGKDISSEDSWHSDIFKFNLALHKSGRR